MGRSWKSGPLPGDGYYYVRGLLDPALGGDNKAVWINVANFTWGFSEHDDPESIQMDSDISPENIQWESAA